MSSKWNRKAEIELYRSPVIEDCENLLSLFQKTDSVRFEVFSKIWREMNFSHIFHGAVKHKKRSFSRLILDSAYSFLLPPFSFQIRVGGLYLLYSLFQSQTAAPPEPIRLALKDWEHVEKFEKDAMDAQHMDVIYILRQLRLQKAFHFSAMPTQLAFRKQRMKESPALCEKFIERASRPQELINIDLLEELSNVHDLYGTLKSSVSETSENSSVNLIRQDLIPQLRNTVVDFYKWQSRNGAADEDEDEGSGEGMSSQQDCSRRAQLIASIKSKAYGEAAEARRSRRHRQVEVDYTSSVAGPSALALSNGRSSKPSLRARTNESLLVSGDLYKGVTSASTISQLCSLDFKPKDNGRTPKD
ncbi:LOW QUALITY PROTEIN: snRNA-activating protein complex subunit 1-like [Trematomus bernacchii]|uniref:LOW QUALITY PROTEIN: snRNA-activating protein complex subunit 1-like n=1 Tax=Trematomus bernacchii TaxID=40690 RepID=UPI00146A4318|nr:LOW QUALITY PROTEIN: snRNA-activating protein complex subunit 1-like [Trematomus bernacchii]